MLLLTVEAVVAIVAVQAVQSVQAVVAFLTLDAPRLATVLDPLSGPPFCGFLRTMRIDCGLHGFALVSSND